MQDWEHSCFVIREWFINILNEKFSGKFVMYKKFHEWILWYNCDILVNEYSWLQKFSELNDASFSRMRASKYIIYLFWVSLIHEIYINIPQISYDKQGWCVPNVSQFEAVWNICGVVSRLNSKRKQDPGWKEMLSYLGRTPIDPIEGEGGKRRELTEWPTRLLKFLP